MAKSTNPITYRYRIDTPFGTRILGLTRRHIGTAYARNGNVGNPAEYFLWDATITTDDYPPITFTQGTGYSSRAEAYEYARATVLGIRYVRCANRPGMHAGVNVRHFMTVQNEMKANYLNKESIS